MFTNNILLHIILLNITFLFLQNRKDLLISRQVKTILSWNLFFDPGIYFFSRKINEEVLIKAGCEVTECLFTEDLNLFNKSDVIIFYAQYLYDIPTYRFPHQKFVFFQMEPPNYSKSNIFQSNQTRFNFFNRTMTYRRDSDIVQRDLYGLTVRKKTSSRIFTDYGFKKNSKLVAWFVSNCNSSNKREDYVTQLSRFVPIDVYGQCGNLTCGDKESSNCFDMLKRDYKFYLAFENSFCPDYVTEKLFKPLYYDTVPIVMGAVDYNFIAPPNSFIDVRNFNSPKHLADYLLMLDKSGDLYERYFDWKRDYKVDLNPMNGWCNLCKFAHDPTVKIYDDIKKWWLDEKECDNSFISSLV